MTVDRLVDVISTRRGYFLFNYTKKTIFFLRKAIGAKPVKFFGFNGSNMFYGTFRKCNDAPDWILLNGSDDCLVWLNVRTKKVARIWKNQKSPFLDFFPLSMKKVLVMKRNGELALYDNFKKRAELNVLENFSRVDEICQNFAINKKQNIICIHTTSLNRASKFIFYTLNHEKSMISLINIIDLFDQNLRTFYAFNFLTPAGGRECLFAVSYAICKCEFLKFEQSDAEGALSFSELETERKELELKYMRKLERVEDQLIGVDGNSKILKIGSR